MKQGGETANLTGSRLKKFIENTIIENGYKYIDNKKFKPAIYLDQPIYSKRFCVGQSIYKTNLFVDLIIYHPQKHPDCLVIKSKWQQGPGSVDEKYPYIILNIQKQCPYDCIFILDGGGYKKEAEKWIRNQVGGKLLKVFTMSEFQKWANKKGL